jgi:hypothetical protein
MNTPYYLEFLNWWLSIGGRDNVGILATKLFAMLRSAEVIALLRVLSIPHITICLPTRWLAGRTQNLAEYNFGYRNMGNVLVLMENAFPKINNDSSFIIDEEFMMEVSAQISNIFDPFQAYLTYMFSEKLSNNVIPGNSLDEKVLPYDLMRAALFYLSCIDILKTDGLCYHLGGEAAATFLIEFHDK